MFRRIRHWLWPPRPPPHKARPAKWDHNAAVRLSTAVHLEWLARETGTPLEKITLSAVRCFAQLPSTSREHLAWQLLTGQRNSGVPIPKEACATLASLRVRKGWSTAQLAAAALEWFVRLPLAWQVAHVREYSC